MSSLIRRVKIGDNRSRVEALVEETEDGERELCRILVYQRRRTTKAGNESRVSGLRITLGNHELQIDPEGNVRSQRTEYETPTQYEEVLARLKCPPDLLKEIKEYVGPKTKPSTGRLF